MLLNLFIIIEKFLERSFVISFLGRRPLRTTHLKRNISSFNANEMKIAKAGEVYEGKWTKRYKHVFMKM